MAEAPSTTWLLVSTMPSGDRMVPEPEPWARRPWRAPRTCTCTTEGDTASTTPTTALE